MLHDFKLHVDSNLKFLNNENCFLYYLTGSQAKRLLQYTSCKKCKGYEMIK